MIMNKTESFVVTTLAVCSGILLAALIVFVGYTVIQGAENRAAAAARLEEKRIERVEKAKPPVRAESKMTEAELQNALEELHKKLKEVK